MIRFNGPIRSSNCAELASDLVLLRMILSGNNRNKKPVSIVVGKASSAGNASTTSQQQQDGQGLTSWTSSQAKALLVEQLPNTVSVSFLHAKASELTRELLDKVRNDILNLPIEAQ